MNITEQLLHNLDDCKSCDALTIGYTYTYEDLANNIHKYNDLLNKYSKKGIDRVGIIVKERPSFDTVSLVFSLINYDITPIIISEKIGENIKGILSKENVKITFYESMIKPECLEKIDVLIDKARGYFATVNPHTNVKNKKKIQNSDWYLSFLNSENEKINGICKLYGLNKGNLLEESVTEEEIKNYLLNFYDMEYVGKWEKIVTTLPLSDKQGFTFLISSLTNCMHVTSLNPIKAEKNIKTILKEKPSIITIDYNILSYLITNDSLKQINLSFLKKAIVYDSKQASLVYTLLSRYKFKGDILVLENEQQKVIKFEEK